MIRKFAVAAVALSALTVGFAGQAEAKTTLKMATLAPKQSPWGKVFSALSKAIDSKTKGEVEVIWLWNGTAGPEDSVVGKMKSGQIAGAAITAVGLSAIHKPIVALQMPGAFKTWAELDAARNKLRPVFDKAMLDAGFQVSGWGDVGVARFMSSGFAVAVPTDLRGKSPGHIRDDIIGPKLYESIGGVTPKPGTVTEFLPMLSSGSINVMDTPSLAAEQFQWASRLDHINTGVAGFHIGATVTSVKALDGLPADQRKLMEEMSQKAAKALTGIIRKEDDGAFQRLTKKMKVHEPTKDESAQWDALFKKACQKVKNALPGDVLSRIGYC